MLFYMFLCIPHELFLVFSEFLRQISTKWMLGFWVMHQSYERLYY